MAAMTREELSELDKRIAASVARGEAAIARQEAAAAKQEEAIARQEAAAAGICEARRRQEEAVSRQEAAVARFDAAMERIAERVDRQEDEGEDLKTFIRNMNLRSEKIVQEFVKSASATLAKMDRMDERAEQRAERFIAGQERSHEEHQAIIKAIFALSDRLPPPSPA
jgi:hypothetical protein